MEKKIQSAMEYLMTYGWAILIISVVLVVLFSMGITNPLFLAPKATAGGCRVVRTSAAQSLEGICNGEIPQYVAQFNGQDSLIGILSLPNIPQSSITISGWVYISGFTSSNGDQEWWTNNAGLGAIGLQSYPNTFPGATKTTLTFFTHNAISTETSVCQIIANLNSWYFVVESVNGNTATLYVNGNTIPGCSFTYSNPGTEKDITIGSYGPTSSGAGNIMDGLESNIQIYNTSLSASEVQALYQEGIGGAPIILQNLVGWWPLNGNANDYSGNNNDGTASNVIWSGTWWQSYTQP